MLLHADSNAGARLIGEVQPAAVPDGDRSPNRVSVSHAFYRGKAAGSLAVPMVGLDADGSVESVTLVQDTYRAYIDDTTTAGISTYYGGAVRLSVTVLGWSANMKLSLPLVAAKVEGEGLKAAYRFEVIGLKDTSVLAEHLPAVGEFTPTSYLGLLQSTHECAKLLVKAEIDPVRLFVSPNGGQVTSIAWTYMACLREISRNGVDDRPNVDHDLSTVDVEDWVVDELLAEAKLHRDPKRWAKDKYNELSSTFPQI